MHHKHKYTTRTVTGKLKRKKYYYQDKSIKNDFIDDSDSNSSAESESESEFESESESKYESEYESESEIHYDSSYEFKKQPKKINKLN